jgi:hypothetical protein
MVVNFRANGINRDARKLTRILIIKKKQWDNLNGSFFILEHQICAPFMFSHVLDLHV